MTRRKCRIAHYGTGHTGAQALQGVIDRPELELVALLVHTPDKVGRDAGEIAGGQPVGVRAVGEFQSFLDVDADCVTYFATDFGRDADQVIGEMCAILASGKNIVTSTMPSLVYPPSLPEGAYQRLRDACEAGEASLFCSGISPGFTVDALVLACSSVCEHIRFVSVAERIFMGAYRDPLSFAFLGFGRTPEEDDRQSATQTLSTGAFAASFGMLGAGLGIDFDEIRPRKDVAVVDADHSFEAGDVPAGTIGSVRLGFDGLKDDEPRVSLSIVYSMVDQIIDDWSPHVPEMSAEERLTELEIRGVPDVNVRFRVSGGAHPGVDATSARVLNAISAVCAATPGLHSALDLPIHGAGAFGH